MEGNQIKEFSSANSDKNILAAMFTDSDSAEKAYNVLINRGYTENEINLIMSDETRKKHFSKKVEVTETGAKTALGEAAVGSAIGGTIGAIVGIVAAISTSLVVPGLGFVIAGPLIAGLAGAGAGVVTGGLIGALAGAGIPEANAKIYESGINKGYIVLGVHPRNTADADYLEQKWKEDKGSDIYR
jgi:predicted phage tail protein